MIPKNNVKLDDHDGVLLCPKCGGINLHQGQVEVWNRPEDAGSGNHVTIMGDSVIRNDDMSENPSPRRQGLSIHFTCEECDHDEKGYFFGEGHLLDIVQHKGSTYISWRSDK